MEQIRTIRNMDRSYLVYTPEREERVENYEMRMLYENEIEGLLRCQPRPKDGKMELYYDITSCTELSKKYETVEMSYLECKEILTQLAETQKRMQTYMMEERYISLCEEHIFVESGSDKMRFLFLPEVPGKEGQGYRKLAEFMLEKVNHKDDQAVKLAYRFYKETKSQYFSIECMWTHIEALEKELLCREQPSVLSGQNHGAFEEQRVPVVSDEPLAWDIMTPMEEASFGVQDKEQAPKKGKAASEKQKTAMTLCAGIAVLCVVVYSQFPELKELGYIVLLAGGIFLGVALGILVYSKKKHGDKNGTKKISKKKKCASAKKKENNVGNPYAEKTIREENVLQNHFMEDGDMNGQFRVKKAEPWEMENQSPHFGNMPQRSMQEEPIRKATQNDYGKTVLLSKTSIV